MKTVYCIWAVCVLLAGNRALAQKGPFRVYYLVIGSADYEHDSRKFRDRDFVPFDNLPEARLSAGIVEQLLKRHAGGKGITLVSTPASGISRKRLMAGLDSLKRMIARDRPAQALTVFYYCGHGISENMAWNQFLVPADYTRVTAGLSFEALSNETIRLGEITDVLDKLPGKYMALIDCCRKEDRDYSLPEERLKYFVGGQNVETFKTVVQVLKILNEYQCPDPVVFSITPGQYAPTVDLPENRLGLVSPESGTGQVGPICRRAILAVNEAVTRGRPASLKDFVSFLANPEIDTLSSVTHFEPDEESERPLIGL